MLVIAAPDKRAARRARAAGMGGADTNIPPGQAQPAPRRAALLDPVADNVLLDPMLLTYATMRVPEPPSQGVAGAARTGHAR